MIKRELKMIRILISIITIIVISQFSSAQQNKQTNPNPNVKFDFGIASFAFRDKPFQEVLTAAKNLDINKVAVKSMHLPYNISDQELEGIIKEANDAGIDIYAGAVIYMKTEEEVRQAFNYAEKAGMEVIVGVPNPELIDLSEEMVKKHDIKLAIHNHGSRDILYPSPESVYEVIKGRDKRMGMCIDVGHTMRLNIDPAEELRKYGDRVLDIQIWDVSSATHEGKAVLPGYGVLNFKNILQALIDINYTGTVSIEYWSEPKHPEYGTAYTLGFMYGILNSISSETENKDNKLTNEEKAEGWQLLFNGKNASNWRGINKDHFPEKGWKITEGCLCANVSDGAESGNGGDIITEKQYSNFVLSFEWKMLTKGGNSGVKYFVQEGIGENENYGFGLEYQILDDANHPWMIEGKMKPGDYHTVGALYELYEAENKKLKPLGEYNHSKVVADGSHVEHWLNGIKVLEFERGSSDFRDRVNKSKFADVDGFGESKEGHILIQDHGSEVCFKNIRIKKL